MEKSKLVIKSFLFSVLICAVLSFCFACKGNGGSKGDVSGTESTESPAESFSDNLDYFNFAMQDDGTYSVAISSKGSLEAKDLVIPNVYNGAAVTKIQNSGFAYIRNLESVTIPENITSIGQNAFQGCIMLTKVFFNAENCTVTEYGGMNGGIFDKCESLTNIIIGENVKTIPSYAFCGCSGITSVTIPDSVTSIGESTFSGCSGLTSITIPDSVISIGRGAFERCDGFTSITLPFVGSSLNCDSDMHFGYIFGASHYLNNESYIPNNLKKVIISSNSGVTSIGESAFRDCSGLSKVYYKGTSEYWNNVFIVCYNSNLTSATMYYYSETEPTTDGNFWLYDENGNIKEWI